MFLGTERGERDASEKAPEGTSPRDGDGCLGGSESDGLERDDPDAMGVIEDAGIGYPCDDGTNDKKGCDTVLVMFYTPWISWKV